MPFQKATMRSNTYIPPGSPELIKQKKNFGNSLENPKFFFYFSRRCEIKAGARAMVWYKKVDSFLSIDRKRRYLVAKTK